MESEFKSVTDDLQETIVRKTKEVRVLNRAIASNDNGISQLRVQLSTASSEKEEQQSNIDILSAKFDSAEAQARERRTEKRELQDKAGERKSRLRSEQEESRSKIDELNALLAELESDHEARLYEVERSEAELNEKLARAQRQHDESCRALEAELEECVDQLELAVEEKEKLSSDLSTKSREVERLTEHLETATSERAVPAQDDAAAGPSRSEIVELKALLASANASVDEARTAALFAEQELKEREAQLEMVHGALAESEEERRLAEDRARPAETSPRNYSARADAEEELLRDMEVLMGEKIDAESRLEQETSRRREAVNEVRKAADEEKQVSGAASQCDLRSIA